MDPISGDELTVWLKHVQEVYFFGGVHGMGILLLVGKPGGYGIIFDALAVSMYQDFFLYFCGGGLYSVALNFTRSYFWLGMGLSLLVWFCSVRGEVVSPSFSNKCLLAQE